jgi:ribosomal-protein-alanine N-acetyltransferase
MICLTTVRLTVRDHIPEDLEPMHRLLSDASAMRYLPDIRTSTLEETRQNLETAISENSRPDREKYYFAVLDRATGKYIGEIGYTVKILTPNGCVAGLGFFILPGWWGRGVTTEAARAVLRYAFTDGGVVKMETGCLKENGASEAVMMKLGMVKEADFKLHVWHEGKLRDRVEYGLTRDEWACADLAASRP